MEKNVVCNKKHESNGRLNAQIKIKTFEIGKGY